MTCPHCGQDECQSWLEVDPNNLEVAAEILAHEQVLRAAASLDEAMPGLKPELRAKALAEVERVALLVYERDLAEGMAAHLKRTGKIN